MFSAGMIDTVKLSAAAGVRRKMRTSSIGLLRRQYPGMMNLYVDENTVMK